jgi:hypothetical protein
LGTLIQFSTCSPHNEHIKLFDGSIKPRLVRVLSVHNCFSSLMAKSGLWRGMFIALTDTSDRFRKSRANPECEKMQDEQASSFGDRLNLRSCRLSASQPETIRRNEVGARSARPANDGISS